MDLIKKLETAIKDIENWKGEAYRSDDEVGLAVESIKEVITEMAKIKFMSGDINDAINGYRTKKQVNVKMDDLGVYVGANGYSTKTSDESEIIMVEQYENKLRVIIWADINQEDPTHIIDLENAKESLTNH